jgi:hypothetical protein
MILFNLAVYKYEENSTYTCSLFQKPASGVVFRLRRLCSEQFHFSRTFRVSKSGGNQVLSKSGHFNC